jgi:hypothetical protein
MEHIPVKGDLVEKRGNWHGMVKAWKTTKTPAEMPVGEQKEIRQDR